MTLVNRNECYLQKIVLLLLLLLLLYWSGKLNSYLFTGEER